MKHGNLFVSLICFVITGLMTVTAVSAQTKGTVEIVGYTHGACIVDGKELRPAFADEGYVSKTHVDSYWNCDNVIGAGIVGCTSAVEHTFSMYEKKYPQCLELFRSWVPECIAHYEAQRPKCEAAIQRYAAKEASEKESENWEGPPTYWKEEGLRSNLDDVLRRLDRRRQGGPHDPPDKLEGSAPKTRPAQQTRQEEGENRQREQRSSSGGHSATSSSPEGATNKCMELSHRIADELMKMPAPNPSDGMCIGAGKQLRMLNYAKENLAKHGCYDGEYDSVIAETESYARSVCN